MGVVNNLLYAFGGTADGLLTITEAYDPQSNTWTSKAPLPAPRKGFAVGVINGILYLAGGSNESGLVATTYSYDMIVALLDGLFELVSAEQAHIFPYRIEKYVKYEYELEPWFAAMPQEMFSALERHLGWHYLIVARPV